MPTSTIYLIRHAQSRPSARTRDAEWPLSDRGARQAEALGGLLSPLGIGELWSSPYRRCLRTIDPFARRTDLVVRVHDGLRERNIVGGISEDFAAVWERSWEDLDFAMPGCESSTAAMERFVAAVDEIRGAAEADTIAICAHGNVIGLFLHHIDRANGRAEAEALTNPDVLRIGLTDGRFTWDRAFELPGLDDIARHPAETRFDPAD